MLATNTPLVAVELLAACIWVGSLVCLALVTGSGHVGCSTGRLR